VFAPPDPGSPKFHDHDVGVFVDVSVKRTVCPTRGLPGEKVKLATGAGGVETVTCFVSGSEPPAFVAVRVTLKVPAEA
jgi:hypothetical protein